MLFIISRGDEFFCSLKLCITTCKIIFRMFCNFSPGNSLDRSITKHILPSNLINMCNISRYCLQLQMLLSKEVDPSDQIVKSLIDQAQMKFQAVNKEHLHKKRDKSRMIEENTVYTAKCA